MRIFLFNRYNYDNLKAVIVEGLLSHNMDLWSDHPASYIHSSQVLNIETWKDLEGFEVIIWGEEEIGKIDLLKGTPLIHQKLIFIDGSDLSKIRLNKKIKPHLILKRELLLSTAREANGTIKSFSFAVEKSYWENYKEHNSRRYDLSCMLRLDSNPFRVQIEKQLKKIQESSQSQFFIGTTGEKPYGDGITVPRSTPIYDEILRNSRISISCHGAGQDCMRFWEILGVGSMLISQKLDIVFHNPFEDGKNIVFFDSVKELTEKTRYYLEKPELVESIAISGHDHAKKYHQTMHRGLYLLSLINDIDLYKSKTLHISSYVKIKNNIKYSLRKRINKINYSIFKLKNSFKHKNE